MNKFNTKQLNFEKLGGIIPAIIQDAETNLVLMLGFMTKEALKKTLKRKKIWFYSRTKKKLWMKGETSKNILRLVEAKLDCDKDSLLLKVVPKGPTCHTGRQSCFREKPREEIFSELFKVILTRKSYKMEGSYTNYLLEKGLNKICAKIKEEAGEVIRAAKKESKKRLIEESADLIYHLLVLLAEKKVDLEEVRRELEKRRK